MSESKKEELLPPCIGPGKPLTYEDGVRALKALREAGEERSPYGVEIRVPPYSKILEA